ncbi:molybdenum cofactor guanylyltransferase MobA [Grimontia marina]|uniref:Molybdenum cofactor guanylyltransferase n=1 Tax=Grimontia marina TaxID=646534 RepID=A0A128ESS7_9GAMM|nr:molybdenum cofactor guanylyltransferase MobA [Grimontia marina]CZF77629.1 Molybdenum cofactor guanylyltransferase [Grimontia marina]
MQPLPETTWVILAGGQARRMGGKDKGLVSLNNKPLIDYVNDRLSEQGANVAVNANRNQETYAKYGQVFSDVFEGFPGPLGGIHAAMAQLDSEWYGFVPCDCPNLPHNLLEKMYQTISDDTEIVVAHDGESVQPVVTMYKRSVFERLENFLNNGDRKIVLLYDICKTEFVDFSDEHDAFINLNTPDELEKFGALS